jgi:hypothetical protein
VAALTPVELQNRLLPVSDRELAVAMLYLQEAECEPIYRALAGPKAARLREELALVRRRTVGRQDYVATVSRVVAVLGGARYTETLGSYLRPVRRRRE